ncbi:cell division control protein 48 homolog C isoform X2 [Magnolia sinica]|uniref:cell division control protein 48 homolog C isoform X2 n=1 Tax=Magnolia sinica TaxID=86752 RepID=UPI00265A1721|nr:cell division control protein 48 homolog C isoform X2 [Magnolia sinica]
MGKRVRGGGGRPPSHELLRRIQACNFDTYNVEQIVERLRFKHPEYRRMKQQPFNRLVTQTLEFQKQRKKNLSSPTNTTAVDNEDADDDDNNNNTSNNPFRSPARKKPKKSDLDEERLLRTEGEFLHRRNKQRIPSSSSSSSSSTGDEEDGAVSTSDDAIYGMKLDPEFDLMKSMLRSNYSAPKPAVVAKKAKEEKNMEVEVVDKARKIVSPDEVKNGLDGMELKSSGNGGGDFEIKGRDGPRFRNFGGIKGVLDELMMEVIVPLYHPQLPRWLGVRPMAGILLHGPPGCGKTKLAHAIANETGVPFYKISATEVVSGVSGASEENIRDLFSKAYRTAPSIVFIDEIDAIASKRENLQREMERRIVTQLMTCMDESHQTLGSVDEDSESSEKRPGYVLVIGATNRPDAVDPALRRPGRFDREIVLGVPDENARVEILSVLTQNLRLEGTFDLLKIARSTPGFVGADLAALANKAGNLAMKRIIDRRKRELSIDMANKEKNEDWWRQPWVPEEMESLSITMADFEEAAKIVQPSSRREGFSTIPNVKWEDVGALDSLRKEFDRYIVRRIKHPEDYEEFGVDLETGFLLYGPPGCGKTLIAKAVANEAGANFIHIKGPELLNKYVGESELAVRTIFSRARTCAPCILFFDEVDALTTKRGKEGGWVVERLLNQVRSILCGQSAALELLLRCHLPSIYISSWYPWADLK